MSEMKMYQNLPRKQSKQWLLVYGVLDSIYHSKKNRKTGLQEQNCHACKLSLLSKFSESSSDTSSHCKLENAL
jgi:hypothetical protein